MRHFGTLWVLKTWAPRIGWGKPGPELSRPAPHPSLGGL